MPSIETLTINESHGSVEEILEVIWRAIEYFPKGLWEEINYIGNISVKHDVKIKVRGEVYNAFFFNNLIEKIRRIRNFLQIRDLLLAVTRDPIVAVYYRFETKKLSRIVNIVRDYVLSDVGIVSLFEVKEDIGAKITAHGLGHNRGLRHHIKPIDMMYEGLLKSEILENEGFCDDCIKKMLDMRER